MTSTLSRNAVIEARFQGLPASLQSYQRFRRIAQHNPEKARLFRLLGVRRNRPAQGGLGCTGTNGWCTSNAGSSSMGSRMSQSSGLMQGKRGVILGVANNRSIAWGIAKACHAAGAEIALTWQGDALKKRVEPLAAELGAVLLGHCDVTDFPPSMRCSRCSSRNGARSTLWSTRSRSPTRTSSTAAISKPPPRIFPRAC